MSKINEESLVRAASYLEQALAAPAENREQSWLNSLRQALTKVDGILFRLPAPTEGELLEPVEPAQRDLCPKLAREVESLRSDLGHMAELVNSLLAKLQRAPADLATFQKLRSAGARLLTELRAFHEAEIDLVLETALRDTGAGD